MFSSAMFDLRAANVYKMMEHLGIESSGGVIPRLGFTYTSAVRTCQKCQSVRVCTEWLEAAHSTSVAPDFCPNADIFFELVMEGWAVPRIVAMH